METRVHEHIVTLQSGLEANADLWQRFFSVSPLVLIGSREADGTYNLAPKHMAIPLGWSNYFGFVCTASHRTYQNVKREEAFTVSYPRPSQVVLTSLAAAPRYDDDTKPSLMALPTFPAGRVDGVLVEDSYLYLECRLSQIVDGFGANSLIVGQVLAVHIHEEALRSTERDDHDLIYHSPLLAYLHPGRFARIDTSYSFPFPAGFRR